MFLILSFVTGIVVVQQLAVLPENIGLIVIFLSLPVLIFLRYWLLLSFVVGLLWATLFADTRLADRLPDELQGQLIQVEGKVVGIPRYGERKVRFDFLISNPQIHFPNKIRLNWYFPKQVIKSGQLWKFTVKLKKPHGRYNPNGFDYEQWLFVQNIGATGYIKTTPAPLFLKTSNWYDINALRQSIADELNAQLKNSEYLGVIKALTIGEKSEVTEQQWRVFRKTGVVHLLAISGLHIGLISGLMYFLVLNISTRFLISSPQVLAASSAVLIACFYAALAGFSIPTQRSLIMLVVAMMAVVWQRNLTVSHTLSLAIFAVVLIDPLAVLSAGFWLSFFAVAVIVYCLAGRLGKSRHWYVAVKIHWITAIGLSPLLLFYFQQVSIISPLANLVAVPVISLLIVPLCFIAVVSMVFSSEISGYVLFVIDYLIQWLYSFLKIIVDLPFAAVTTVPASFYALILAVFGVIVLLSPKGLPARWLGFVLLLPLFLSKQDELKQGEVMMTLLDVGQGLATVIETKNHTLVFDTGAKYSEHYDMGKAVVIPFLQSKAINVVDKIIISHADNDHIGGAESIIKNIKVKQVMSSVPEKLNHADLAKCQSGQVWVWDEVKFEVLFPDSDLFSSDNNNSCVVKVSSQHGSILLTGDIESKAERWLVANQSGKLESDVLIAPHHGSKSSSSIGFLKSVNPDFILIPAGYKNRFSFPHNLVIERYNKMNAKWLATFDSGAIVVDFKKNMQIVSSLRAKQGKYWN